jgi:hypothetical protein
MEAEVKPDALGHAAYLRQVVPAKGQHLMACSRGEKWEMKKGIIDMGRGNVG